MPDQTYPIGQLIHKKLTEDPNADWRDVYADMADDPKAEVYFQSYDNDPEKIQTAIESTLQGYRTFVGKEQEPTNWKEMLTPDRNTPGRFGKGLLNAAKGLLPDSFESAVKNTASMAFPPAMAARQISTMMDQFGKAKQEMQQGNTSGAVGQGLAGITPFGTWASGIGEKMGEGNISEGAGELAGGLGMRALAPQAVKAAPYVEKAAKATKRAIKTSKALPYIGDAGAVGGGIALALQGHPMWGTAVGMGGIGDAMRRFRASNAPTPQVAPPPISNRGSEIFSARKAEPPVQQVAPPPVRFREQPAPPPEPKVAPPPVRFREAAPEAPKPKAVAPPPIRYTEKPQPKPEAAPKKIAPPPIRTTAAETIKSVLAEGKIKQPEITLRNVPNGDKITRVNGRFAKKNP